MRIDRAKLRGKPLDKDCRFARRSDHEYGLQDNRVFCYGLYTDMSDGEIQEKCKVCGAFVDNAKPLERVIVYQESTQSYTSEVAE